MKLLCLLGLSRFGSLQSEPLVMISAVTKGNHVPKLLSSTQKFKRIRNQVQDHKTLLLSLRSLFTIAVVAESLNEMFTTIHAIKLIFLRK